MRMTSQTSAESYEYEEESSASEESDIDDNSEAGQTATGSAGGGTSKASDKGKSEQVRRHVRANFKCDRHFLFYLSKYYSQATFRYSSHRQSVVNLFMAHMYALSIQVFSPKILFYIHLSFLLLKARPRARCDVDELNAYMSSPDALAAFHGSKYCAALVGAAAARESTSEDRDLPPASIAASGAAVPPPPPPLPAPAEDENAAEAAEVAARAEMIRAAVAARSKHGGVRMELWCRRILWIAIDPARFFA